MELPFLKKKEEIPGIPVLKPKTGASVKDIIAPSALEVSSDNLRLAKRYCRTIFAFTYPRYLNTSWFSPVINLDRHFDISMYINPIDTSVALKNLRKKVAQVESALVIKEEKGQVRDPILETAYKDLENLRDQLQTAQEKLFQYALYITIYEDEVAELDKTENQIRNMLESRLVYAKTAMYQQEEGFNSTLPLGTDRLQVLNTMNSAPLSTTFPFVSADLTSDKGILYGINRHNNSLILFDRFSLENGNMVIFAKAGSGKSYASKLEILRSLMMGTDVIVIDPENEYKYLADTVGGAFFRISLTGEHHINPFDLPVPHEDEKPADLLRANIINLVGLLRLMLGSLTAEEDAVIDKALSETYASRDITAESDFSQITPPLMSDLQTILENMEGGANLALRLKKYTEGTFAGFLNMPTNVSADNRLAVFNIRDMEDELRPIAMYVILGYIWRLIRRETKKRILVVDEAWLLMKYEDAASFLYGIAKRCRKYYLGLTTITQDVGDFMNSRYGRPIITNSSLQLLLRQSPATIDLLVQTFNLTEEEKYLLLEAGVGEGLFVAGLKHAAIRTVASYSEDQVITSDPEQLLKIEKAKKELAEAEAKVI
ncbi:MAG: Type IV secretory pathway VirB4 protein-like protein [Candidatus Azambacteria bacterium GW2011_GWB2_46_37]|uniref:Type IV secretory pathway VirB4 protein-like protein n=3 Tax=Candidatus Azamiibacteriota TaxID=1752741 RepID=A0A0G1RPN5_9BACT|nr:MAG: Type IV secretory pathway VirB4 protein-like protein [Candidatus Azambacteria bacterium GW2011_GWC1_46_13]KKU37696.1 MAG: Type IV secretory pathway VirB4 protein-like protein [Candidatus Azambacteria bacterium GW2011_GWF2_46_32]KKU39607.1 MAG: Type IV secretory pathway VirB4 protein-like protein [Candidatus Azambacteria bacterium GW2011_GWB2_46_37]HAM96069.1 conjugal transfer protein TraC [Candidatus Azambacteria bacterium]HBA52223.1 conjugal transfer protein TraC [Candidatus Azambacter